MDADQGARAQSGPGWVRDPGRVTDLARAIREGRSTSSELVERCLERIEEAEPAVRAWRLVDGAGARSAAAERDEETRSGRCRGPLHGVPIGIKDIIDVEGLPTRCNSRSREDAPPAGGDAVIVAALKAAGAVVLGKLHTTEYAFFDPSPARNPYDTAHTPGGSSSGSGAAVAAGMVPMAVGTQTVASVNRPAAYCGVAAFKPSTGLLSTFGIAPLGPMYDTPGLFGWSVRDAAEVFSAICPPFVRGGGKRAPDQPLHVTRLRDSLLDDADPAVVAGVDRVGRRLAGLGHEVRDADSPVDFARLFEHQQTSMHYEAARALGWLADQPQGTVGPRILGAIEHGRAISESEYASARGAIDAARSELFAAESRIDLFLWPATPGTAPEGLEWTGDPRYIAPWTALAGPVVTVPAGLAASGLPVAALLCGHPGDDRRLADVLMQSPPVESREPLASG